MKDHDVKQILMKDHKYYKNNMCEAFCSAKGI